MKAKVLYGKRTVAGCILNSSPEILAVCEKDVAFSIFNHMWKHREIYFQSKRSDPKSECRDVDITVALFTIPITKFENNVIDERDELRNKIAGLLLEIKEKDDLLNKLTEKK
jgi:hypothetical protein